MPPDGALGQKGSVLVLSTELRKACACPSHTTGQCGVAGLVPVVSSLLSEPCSKSAGGWLQRGYNASLIRRTSSVHAEASLPNIEAGKGVMPYTCENRWSQTRYSRGP